MSSVHVKVVSMDGKPVNGPEWITDDDGTHTPITVGESAEDQIKRLADFIADEVPGEPSQSQGAVDTAIRWMRDRLAN